MATQLRSFLRLRQLKAITGMSRTWIYDAIQRGDFPKPVALGARAVGWLDSDVAAFIQSRIDASRPNVGGVKA